MGKAKVPRLGVPIFCVNLSIAEGVRMPGTFFLVCKQKFATVIVCLWSAVYVHFVWHRALFCV